MISKGVMLVTVTGRKSGKPISTPTNYLCDGDRTVLVLRDFGRGSEDRRANGLALGVVTNAYWATSVADVAE